MTRWRNDSCGGRRARFWGFETAASHKFLAHRLRLQTCDVVNGELLASRWDVV